MPPTRRPALGQHFLRDTTICTRIVDAVAASPDIGVIEIGPGQGVLTERLLEKGVRLTAIEIDSALAGGLRERFGDRDGFEVIEQDVLKVDLSLLVKQLGAARVVICGNLPYYITSPILRRVFDVSGLVEQAVFLIQREVALRLAAPKNTRDYGFLTVLCRLHSEPELLFSVPPDAFRPPPKVTSAVVRLAMRPSAAVEAGFVEFARKCFTYPRKKLRNNLAEAYPNDVSRQRPELELRAQQLDVTELIELWRSLEHDQAAVNAAEPVL
ncbi:MAG: 16S rRNA (adenine(1518)-N(6)/adenine(1519)-N(6))-dimethyltransferase RsmA [Acidobacteria bacterium]|nr:16S rRNA (adenine(1518)-N(6)/adenine(1519)-N(6))-dimethyltransferase RsmA [Acidobacteriota bacterium]